MYVADIPRRVLARLAESRYSRPCSLSALICRSIMSMRSSTGGSGEHFRFLNIRLSGGIPRPAERSTADHYSIAAGFCEHIRSALAVDYVAVSVTGMLFTRLFTSAIIEIDGRRSIHLLASPAVYSYSRRTRLLAEYGKLRRIDIFRVPAGAHLDRYRNGGDLHTLRDYLCGELRTLHQRAAAAVPQPSARDVHIYIDEIGRIFSCRSQLAFRHYLGHVAEYLDTCRAFGIAQTQQLGGVAVVHAYAL